MEIMDRAREKELDAYLARYYDPAGDAERDYQMAWALAFGERRSLVDDDEAGSSAAETTTGALGILGAAVGEIFSRSMLDKILAKRAATFSEWLLRLMKKYQLKPAEVYHQAGLTKELFSKIKNNPDYHPTRETVLAIIIVLLAASMTRERRKKE